MNLVELQELIEDLRKQHFFYKDDELKKVSRKGEVAIYEIAGYYFKFKTGSLDCCWLEDNPTPITIEEWKNIATDKNIAYIIEAEETNEELGLAWNNVEFVDSTGKNEGDNNGEQNNESTLA